MSNPKEASAAKKPKLRYLTFEPEEIGTERTFSGIFHNQIGWNPCNAPVPPWIKVKDLQGWIVSDKGVRFRRIDDGAGRCCVWRPVTGPSATIRKVVAADLTHLREECPTCHRTY